MFKSYDDFLSQNFLQKSEPHESLSSLSEDLIQKKLESEEPRPSNTTNFEDEDLSTNKKTKLSTAVTAHGRNSNNSHSREGSQPEKSGRHSKPDSDDTLASSADTESHFELKAPHPARLPSTSRRPVAAQPDRLAALLRGHCVRHRLRKPFIQALVAQVREARRLVSEFRAEADSSGPDPGGGEAQMLRMLRGTLHTSVAELADRLTRPEPVPSSSFAAAAASGGWRRPQHERTFLRKGQGRVAVPLAGPPRARAPPPEAAPGARLRLLAAGDTSLVGRGRYGSC